MVPWTTLRLNRRVSRGHALIRKKNIAPESIRLDSGVTLIRLVPLTKGAAEELGVYLPGHLTGEFRKIHTRGTNTSVTPGGFALAVDRVWPRAEDGHGSKRTAKSPQEATRVVAGSLAYCLGGDRCSVYRAMVLELFPGR
jgi:hypothetical protein